MVELMLVTWFVMWSEVQLIFGSWFYHSSRYIYNFDDTTHHRIFFDDATNPIYCIYLMLYSFGLMLDDTLFDLFFVFILSFARSCKRVILPWCALPQYKHKLYTKRSKYKFSINKVKFLRFIITTKGVITNSIRVKSIA